MARTATATLYRAPPLRMHRSPRGCQLCVHLAARDTRYAKVSNVLLQCSDFGMLVPMSHAVDALSRHSLDEALRACDIENGIPCYVAVKHVFCCGICFDELYRGTFVVLEALGLGRFAYQATASLPCSVASRLRRAVSSPGLQPNRDRAALQINRGGAGRRFELSHKIYNGGSFFEPFGISN